MRIPGWLVLLTAVSFGWLACSKGDDPAQSAASGQTTATKPGTIAGIVVPMTSPDSNIVTVTNSQTGATVTAKPDYNGSFSITGLAAGNYHVSVRTGSITAPAATFETTLGSGQAADLGRIDIGSTITGSVSPAAGALYATIIGPRGILGPFYLDGNGKFSIQELPAGSYRVMVSPVWGFALSDTAARRVSIEYKKPGDVGVFIMTGGADPVAPNTMSFDLDGVGSPVLGYPKASYAAPKFSITKSEYVTVQSVQTGGYLYSIDDDFTIFLDDVNGPGTYTCKGTSSSMIRLIHRNSSKTATGNGVWTTSGAGGSGSVTITSIDPVKRTLTGTFSGVLVPADTSTKGTRTITNGIFGNFIY